MSAIFKREMKSYFTTPWGYVFLSVMFLLGGYFFWDVLRHASTLLRYVFTSMVNIVIVLIPLLTMRLLSEDKKLKTDQLLLTAPVSTTGLVMGKYLAAALMFLIGIAPTIVYAVIMATFAPVDWQGFLGNFLGLLLIGMALLAIGLFISSLTESQMIAAIITLVIMIAILSFDSIASVMPTGLAFLGTLLGALSFTSRYSDLVSGLLNLSHILYFVSVAVAFIFLTIRMLERKRWS